MSEEDIEGSAKNAFLVANCKTSCAKARENSFQPFIVIRLSHGVDENIINKMDGPGDALDNITYNPVEHFWGRGDTKGQPGVLVNSPRSAKGTQPLADLIQFKVPETPSQVDL